MVRPNVTEVLGWSKVDFSEFDEPFTEPELINFTSWANDYVEETTGLASEGLTPPDTRISTFRQAVQLRVEQLAYQAQPDYVETGTDDQVSNFSAGAYSETRDAAPGSRRGMVQGVFPAINPWHKLNLLLWSLMTAEKREYWNEVLNIVVNPAFEVSEVDWQWNEGSGYNVLPGERGHGI